MHCPYHGDATRSASLNINQEVFHCHGCGESGNAGRLLKDKPNWILPTGTSTGKTKRTSAPAITITDAMVEGWHSSLLSRAVELKALKERRGLTDKTIKKYQLGWDVDQRSYTIPIRDFGGRIVNVRRYQLDPGPDRRKIWSVAGMGTPTLWPMDQLDYPAIVVCEGEMDALLSIQSGVPAITRTGAADVWKPQWSLMFKDKRVYVCHDMDSKGQLANKKVSAALRHHAATVQVVALPYPVTDDHGKDLTDFWLSGKKKADFIELMKAGKPVRTLDEVRSEEPVKVAVSVMDSFDATLVERPLSMSVTVTGKRTPSYLLPKTVQFDCDVGAGAKCESCSLSVSNSPAPGQMITKINADEPLILSMINVEEGKLYKVIAQGRGLVVKCNRWDLNVTEHRTVEEVYVRPSIEDGPGTVEQDFTHRKVISAVSHDLKGNESVVLTGTIRPDPKTQLNEFQAWNVARPVSNLDLFTADDELRREMEKFQTDNPLIMMRAVADDIATHHTGIYSRPELHMFMDIVFHSVIQFPWRDGIQERGWLDAMVIGDTRTGKSEAAKEMCRMYQLGEMISCESATYAGVVGGLDRMGDGKWIIKWGSIPVNDRRLVVLDEVGGLLPAQIAQMSSIRSTGMAEMTKIESERAHARTRLIWVANPRDSSMDNFTYGVQAVQPLIGNPEDIARFDMIMGTFNDDVASQDINRPTRRKPPRLHSLNAYKAVCRWAWTRKASNIRWATKVSDFVFEQATKLGDQYVDTPPLIQGANVKEKLSRIAVAIAARCYSTEDGEELVIRHEHVQAAVDFLDLIYSHERFGYGTVSKQRHIDHTNTVANEGDILAYIAALPNLGRFLTNNPSFKRVTFEMGMNVQRDEAGSIIQKMWGMQAVAFDGDTIKVEPFVLAKLRGTMYHGG